MKKITLKKLLTIKNAYIIDVRDYEEYIKEFIFGSVNIPFLDLYNNFELYLNKVDTYYILCQEGFRSKKIVNLLSKMGYNVILIKDGIQKLNKLNF